ncbi:recombinase zinc beta ribbon domain-containing protein [Neobacillus niacini]|uniref:recombinase zinc beta ribbon domain-containing protein n=1 Tax=Neobacillus niacini TaxID=86668 RepID=UPI001EE70C47|nr:recombinase zinc beta ribbon domain-containing protein [Neobacillus niacini]
MKLLFSIQVRDIFEAVQQNLMKQRKKFITAPKLHLFTNILFCADCSKGMWFRSNLQNGYVCGNYARHGKKACSAHTIKENFLKETILYDIRTLVQEIDKEQYLKELEAKSKKSKEDLQQKLDKLIKQIAVLKNRKKNFIKMLADENIKHDEYLDMVEDNNTEMIQLVGKKNEMLLMLESEQVIDNIDKLKQELLHFLNFDELTPEILHRLINRIDVKEDGTPVIHYRFAAPTFE